MDLTLLFTHQIATENQQKYNTTNRITTQQMTAHDNTIQQNKSQQNRTHPSGHNITQHKTRLQYDSVNCTFYFVFEKLFHERF